MSTTVAGPGSADSGGSSPAPSPGAPSPGSGASAEPRSTFSRDIKPIPEKLTGKPASLPGVSPDPDFGDGDSDTDSGEQQAQQQAGPQRGPDGRFLPADPSKIAAKSAPDELQQQPAKTQAQEDPNAPAPPAKITFMGREFESMAQVEQAHKTMLGRLRSEHARAAENYTAALAWKNRAEELEREIATRAQAPQQPTTAGRPGGAPAQPGSSPSSEEQAFAETFDWRTYLSLQKEDPIAAEYFRMQQFQEFTDARLEAKLAPLMRPVQEQREQQEFRGKAVQAFSQVAAEVDDEGNPMWPEMADEQARYAIGEIWAQSGLDASSALSPYAIRSAIAHYRLKYGSRPPASHTLTNPQAAAQKVAQSVAQAAPARNGVVEPPPTPGVRTTGQQVQDFASEYKARFRRDILGENNGLAKLPGVSP